MEDDRTRATEAGRRVGERVDRVFEALHAVAPLVREVLGDGPVPRAALGTIDRALVALTDAHSAVVDGSGVAFAPGSLTDAPRWLEWWRLHAVGGTEFRRHVFNPASLRDYDYTQMRWYALALADGRPVAVGPYLDTGGTDRNVITLSLPVVTAVGTSVIAADLRLDGLERLFRDALPGVRTPMVLTNGAGRVVASRSARSPAGALVDDRPSDSSLRVASADPRRLPWRVVVLPTPPPVRPRNKT